MTDIYGLIGFPLGHSFSMKYFSEKFHKENIDAKYLSFPIDNINLIKSIVEDNACLKGLNVTIPYKEEIMQFLNRTSEEVKSIGAVNVIKVEREGNETHLNGFNTDYIGFRDSLMPLINRDIKKALILGTGGASKAIEYALKNMGIETTKVSRNPEKGDITYDMLSESIMRENLLIVNTTPLGMYPNVSACPPIPYSLLTNRHICYDLVYNPEITEFMRRSLEEGAKVKNGLEMLHRQAEAAWEIWQQ